MKSRTGPSISISTPSRYWATTVLDGVTWSIGIKFHQNPQLEEELRVDVSGVHEGFPMKLFLSLKAFDVYEGARKVGYGEVLSS